MSIKVFITIDTEEDLWSDWRQKDNPVDNICRITILQDLFDRFGAIPTYLVNYPVVANENARNILRRVLENYRCEIGTHCHPWNTPPFEEEITIKNSMMCNLPHELLYKKINVVHEKIIKCFGIAPICFRAGRWGFGPDVAQCIYEHGYKIDTSVSPFCDWTKENGPDFSQASTKSYKFNPDNVISENTEGGLLEVPPTIGFLQRNFNRCAALRKWVINSSLSRYHFLGVLEKLRILNLLWLSPELSSGSEMVLLAKNFIRKGHSFLNMTFHSTSLLPGKSPFIRNDHEFHNFFEKIEMFLQFAVDNGLKFSPLSDALEELDDSE